MRRGGTQTPDGAKVSCSLLVLVFGSAPFSIPKRPEFICVVGSAGYYGGQAPEGRAETGALLRADGVGWLAILHFSPSAVVSLFGTAVCIHQGARVIRAILGYNQPFLFSSPLTPVFVERHRGGVMLSRTLARFSPHPNFDACSPSSSTRTLSSSSAPSSSCSDYSSTDETPLPGFSKREYLMAQLRQKDAIIESLLKQVCLRPLLTAKRAEGS